MKFISLARVAAAIVLIALGCRKELPYTDNSKDADLYAQNVRTLIIGLADTARGSSEPQTQVRLIVTELRHDDRPFGQYKDVYSELLTTSRTILDRCQPGTKPDIRKELDQLTTLARKLPEKKS